MSCGSFPATVAIYDSPAGAEDWRPAMDRLSALPDHRCLLLASPVNDEYLCAELVRHGGFDVLPRSASRDQIISNRGSHLLPGVGETGDGTLARRCGCGRSSRCDGLFQKRYVAAKQRRYRIRGNRKGGDPARGPAPDGQFRTGAVPGDRRLCQGGRLRQGTERRLRFSRAQRPDHGRARGAGTAGATGEDQAAIRAQQDQVARAAK